MKIRKTMKKILSALLCTAIVMGLSVNSYASENKQLDNAVTSTAKFMYETVKDPQVGSIGGEWAVLGLARSGYEVPEQYYQDYYKTVEEYVKACGGVLHNKKYTEYSRLTVALTSIGKDPSNVAGYNLLTPLGDYDKTIWQGLNGPIWALIALDSGSYEMPVNKDAETQATRDMYIQRILDCQLPDGGWSLFGGTAAASSGDGISDPDITGMALQALAKYQDRAEVKKATEEALLCMSKQQNKNGGFSSWGTENSESCVQMLVALCELGIDINDSRFVKNGNTLLDNLMTYYEEGKGFKHTYDGSGSNQMAAEQGFYGIVAAKRLLEGKNSLYRMSDSIKIENEKNETSSDYGLEGRNKDVKKQTIVYAGKTFSDISAHKNQPAVEALSARGIINGKSEDAFEPDSTMTRAEFSAIIVKGLGLSAEGRKIFEDVPENSWYYGYIATAYDYGIIKGLSADSFNPGGNITREEAAVMVARAAALCGMDTNMETSAARDIMAGFTDYAKVSSWALTSMAFCYNEDILDDSVMEVKSKQAVTRAEIAQMLFNMLVASNLI
ncbi:MAG: S-layer homology domain-containing protein [Anaerovoracaceae bacterium]